MSASSLAQVNRLIIESAEREAVELDDRGEKWAALTIVALLAIIEDLHAAQAKAWDEGVGYCWEYETPSTDENPYRSLAREL